MSDAFPALRPITNQARGLGQRGELAHLVEGSVRQLSSPATYATITIGDETANVRAITIQLYDANGDERDQSDIVQLFVAADADGLALASTGGSTGIEAGTDGAILDTPLAKKIFVLSSETDGDIDLTWTDTGTEAVYLILVLPNGNRITSAVVQNAA